MFECEVNGEKWSSDYTVPEFVAEQWIRTQPYTEDKVEVDVNGLVVTLYKDEYGEYLGEVISQDEWQWL